MLSSITKVFRTPLYNAFLSTDNVLLQQTRTTYILKRKHPAPLHKEGHPLKRLRPRYYIYELVKDTNLGPRPPINLILTHYVKGLGNPGEKVTVKQDYGYNHLLLPGLAVYETPDNLEKYKDCELDNHKLVHSSANAQITAERLGSMLLSVVMNMENPWTIQNWHITASFRKCGYIVPEEAITIPDKPIKGPNLELEDKEFYVVVTINNCETVNVRCRIHHWSTSVVDRLQHIHEYWKIHHGPIFPEDEPILAAIPKRHELVKTKYN